MTDDAYESQIENRVAERTRELVAANEAAERALRESEARFRALIENSLDITAILDARTGVRYVSPSVERILGYSPDELAGQTSLDFVHPDDAEALTEIFATSVDDPGLLETSEFRARHKDGT